MPTATASSGLYGIHNSNRGGDALWGKNQFNSTFPTSLACYMRDTERNALYVHLDNNCRVVVSEISISEVFNTSLPNDQLQFDFESKFEPYARYSLDDIGSIDLVVKHHADDSDSKWRRPLEVKLTVIPDNRTSIDPPHLWGSEIVIRPASTMYCVLGIFDSCVARRAEVREILEPVCGTFENWSSSYEVVAKKGEIVGALNGFQRQFHDYQKPFLLQPTWKTEGKSPEIANDAFDLFVWSDFALWRMFLDRSLVAESEVRESRAGNVSRFLRSSVRTAKAMYELATRETAALSSIYSALTFGLQTDKEFALPGTITRGYLNHPRRTTPLVPRDALREIILGNGQTKLSPERRFDASVYFAADRIFDSEN